MITLVRTSITLFILFFSIQYSTGQNISLDRVEPPNWWTGMEHTEIQLLVYGENISKTNPSINDERVTVHKISSLESPNYLFIDITISNMAKPGSFDIVFTSDEGKKLTYSYELKAKKNRNTTEQSINASDVLYLITPDRFANGDPKNDTTENMLEKKDRSNPDGRHGGDLEGIINHFDYIKDLGITTLWLNPFLENNQAQYSYHGYAISDYYKTDPRFGSNDQFIELVELCHKNDMKMIMDQVFNHCGSGHWWMKDVPSKDWVNQWDSFTKTSFTNIAASDPHASQRDYDIYTKGWFDSNMPDLNQKNPYLANYLIQNSIWWIEYAGLDGIRMDTYPYPDKDMMAEWVVAVLKEYPNFYIVGETWETKASSLSYWNRKEANHDGYTPHLPSVSDYPLYYSLLKAFGKENHTYKLYETLAEDFVYGNPSKNKTFNGNHDVGRLFTLLDEDVNKLKLSMAFILTTRGIPQLYYGDELLLKGDKPDGNLRKDFPGGWKSDTRNAFTKEGRTEEENEVHSFVSTILNWRKNAKEIHLGKLKHYQPYDDIYVYERFLNNERTLVILNNSNKSIKAYSLERFKESFEGYTKATDIISNTDFSSIQSIDVHANTAYILKLKR